MHTILIADDSTTIQKAVEIVFDKEPFSVVKAGSGAEAVQRCRDAKPALVLDDHLMPDKTGYEVAEALRADPSTAQIPILILSGSSAPFDEGRAKAAGVLGHVPKPFDCTSLLEKVKNILGVTASGPVAGSGPVAATPAAVAATPRPPSVPGFGNTPRPPTAGLPRPASQPAGAAAGFTEVPRTGSQPAPISSVPMAAAVTRDLDPFGFGKGLSTPPVAASVPVAATPAARANPFSTGASAGGAGLVSTPTPVQSRPMTTPSVASAPPSATDDRWSTGRDASIDVAMDEFADKPASKPVAAKPLERKTDNLAAQSLSDSEFMEVSDADAAKDTAKVNVNHLAALDEAAERVAAKAVATGAAPSSAALTAEARAIVEKIAWEVVPELAETIIREEIKRLLAGK